MKPETLDSILFQIKTDLAAVKTDVTWLKRLFSGVIILVGLGLGIDLTGMV